MEVADTLAVVHGDQYEARILYATGTTVARKGHRSYLAVLTCAQPHHTATDAQKYSCVTTRIAVAEKHCYAMRHARAATGVMSVNVVGREGAGISRRFGSATAERVSDRTA